ncbi:MAG TPA: zinc-binding alcohol dehydrogenase family protein [Acidocella sp.]|nr:zinc-binding alcohol dehydrogenase family protein [Acidocella sp.]
MKAVAFIHSKPITEIDALEDFDLPKPEPRHHDLLVEIKAVSVNPVDTKLRLSEEPLGEPRILGFDAAGIVREIGPDVQNFAVGDEVFYAGIPTRPGTNAQFHLVDDRIVGHKPKTLSFPQAAALPLTALTAWEMLFDRFMIPRGQGEKNTLLIVGGAGGVGSIAVQMAAHLTNLTVVATASQPETADWCRALGAHHVVNHTHDMATQFHQFGIPAPDYIFCTAQVRQHFKKLTELLAPEGAIGIIEPTATPADITTLLRKSATLHTEYVFARGILKPHSISAQHHALEEISHLVDNGTLISTMTEHYGTISAANLIRAHAALETGRVRGKIVLEGF